MAERLSWWTIGGTVVGGMFALCLYGFTFLNNRVDAAQTFHNVQIKDARQETANQIQNLRTEINGRLDRIDSKVDVLIRRP